MIGKEALLYLGQHCINGGSLILNHACRCQRIDGVLQGLNERTLLARQSTASSVQTKLTYENTLAEVKELAKQAPALPKRSFRSANIAPAPSGRFL